MPPNTMIGRLLQAKSACVGNEQRGISVRNVLFNAVPTSNRDQVLYQLSSIDTSYEKWKNFPVATNIAVSLLQKWRRRTWKLYIKSLNIIRNTPTLLYAVSTSRPTNCTTMERSKIQTSMWVSEYVRKERIGRNSITSATPHWSLFACYLLSWIYVRNIHDHYIFPKLINVWLSA